MQWFSLQLAQGYPVYNNSMKHTNTGYEQKRTNRSEQTEMHEQGGQTETHELGGDKPRTKFLFETDRWTHT